MSVGKYVIRPLVEGDWPAWEALANDHGPVFLRRAWLRLFEPALRIPWMIRPGRAPM